MTLAALDVVDLRARVHKALAGFLADRAATLARITTELDPVTDAVADFVLGGGKRLRPAFCYWGWRGASAPDCEAIVAAAASLELLHAGALVHDDVMDGSDVRRGRPAVHRRFAALHRGEEWLGEAESFGRAAAVLLGDLCLVWSDQMLQESGLDADALARAGRVYADMRTEVMAGQYLDVLEQARGGRDVARALRVARYKSAKYTIERPLHLGAALAGAPPELFAAYTAYGVPLGEAFQLRDDVLGVFGDPEETGKPAGDDLREGKRTALVAEAAARATPAQAAVVRRHLGDPLLDATGVEELREVIAETGALAAIEQLIDARSAQALAAVDVGDVAEPARGVLRELAVAATARRR